MFLVSFLSLLFPCIDLQNHLSSLIHYGSNWCDRVLGALICIPCNGGNGAAIVNCMCIFVVCFCLLVCCFVFCCF